VYSAGIDDERPTVVLDVSLDAKRPIGLGGLPALLLLSLIFSLSSVRLLKRGLRAGR
jgi:hypothetical protein